MGFKDDLETDLEKVFFNTTEFAEPVTYKNIVTGQDYAMVGLFDETPVLDSVDTEMQVVGHEPRLILNKNQLPLAILNQGDRFLVLGKWYTVKTVEDNQLGHLTVWLYRGGN